MLLDGRRVAGKGKGPQRASLRAPPRELERVEHLDNDGCHDAAEDNEFDLERHSDWPWALGKKRPQEGSSRGRFERVSPSLLDGP